MSVKVRGMANITANLNKEINKIEGGTRAGLQRVGMFIKAESMELTPVEYGVLRNSAYYSTEDTPKGLALRVGYTAKYAPFVHEMPMKHKGKARPKPSKGTFWSTGQNKFLEEAVTDNHDMILRILRKAASIK